MKFLFKSFIVITLVFFLAKENKAQNHYYLKSFEKIYLINTKPLYVYINIYRKINSGNINLSVTLSDYNSQYLKILNKKILFDNTNVMFNLDSSKLLIFSPLCFCKASYLIDNKEYISSLNGDMFKVSNCQSNNGYIYLIENPHNKKTVMLYNNNNITVYVPLENDPNAFLSVPFYFKSPITYLLSTKFKSFFINQLLLELEKNKVTKLNFGNYNTSPTI